MAEVAVSTRRSLDLTAENGVLDRVQDLVRALHSQNLRLDAVYLYGSHAAGTAGPDSDIDVAVISPDLTGDRLEDWVRLTFVATSIDPRFEVVGFRPEQFRDEHPLVWEVRTRGILVTQD